MNTGGHKIDKLNESDFHSWMQKMQLVVMLCEIVNANTTRKPFQSVTADDECTLKNKTARAVLGHSWCGNFFE